MMVAKMNITQIGKSCFGCRNCEKVCSKGAIHFDFDKEGFLSPTVDEKKCVHCSLCLKACPNENKLQPRTEVKTYGFINGNHEHLMKSSSGGFAFEASMAVLKNGGYVAGCVFDDSIRAIHILSNSPEDIAKMQTSKYVQSDLGNVFDAIKEKLNAGKDVLFIGTPCQVHALQVYLKKPFDHLLTIDIICHGCPSPGLFRSYIRSIEKKENERICNFKFRFKKENEWGRYNVYYEIPAKKTFKIKNFFFEAYGFAFLKCLSFRESCYSCRYTSPFKRPGDLTIGDFWHVQEKYSAKDMLNGTSAVLVHSEKGQIFLEKNIPFQSMFDCDLSDIVKWQENLNHPVARPSQRNHYYNGFDENFYMRVKGPSKFWAFVRSLFPRRLKYFLKSFLKK